MLKRMFLMLMILLLSGSAALAEEQTGKVVKAAAAPERRSLERYASFEQSGTVWSVRSNQAQAALTQMGWGYVTYEGYACFGLELTGDSETGLTVPVLAFYYDGTQVLNARAASIAVNGTRYDFMLCREEITVGKATMERFTAPLNQQGLDMLRTMLTGEKVQVWLHGDFTFEMQIDPADTSYANTREELAARSLGALSDMLREFDSIKPYELWDLNEAWWTRMNGSQPQAAQMKIDTDATIVVSGITLKAPMYMLSRGAVNENVRALQKLLIAGGFMQGSADGVYGEGTVRAVTAVQRWHSLLPTGSADEVLIRLLSGEELSAPAEEGGQSEGFAHTAQGICEMSIRRYWFASAVESVGGDRRSVLDQDDTMLIYEGRIKNLSTADLDFYWQMSAAVRCGEYEYPCVLVCERNAGNSLTSSLPPLGQARLLIYAEIPETAVGMGEWKLEVKTGDHVFLFE